MLDRRAFLLSVAAAATLAASGAMFHDDLEIKWIEAPYDLSSKTGIAVAVKIQGQWYRHAILIPVKIEDLTEAQRRRAKIELLGWLEDTINVC